MKIIEKLVYSAGVCFAIAVVGLVAVYKWSATVPSRPHSVPANAVFLWAPHIGLPAPRRGWWISCWETTNALDFCQLTDISGNIEYTGEFKPYGTSKPLTEDELYIDAEKSTDSKLWLEHTFVPLVWLKNGKVLIPASKYQEGVQLLEQSPKQHNN